MSNTDPIDQFRQAIAARGITPPKQIIPDGKIHRFSSSGKVGNDAGWYAFRPGKVSTGTFGDFRTDVNESWRADIGRELTSEEKSAHRAQVEKIRRAHEADELLRYAEASRKIITMLESGSPASSDHPYLQRKGVDATETLHEIHLDKAVEILGYLPKAKGELLSGRLLLAPVHINGNISTIEMIDGAGRKSAIYGGKKKGGYWAAQPLPDGGDGAGQIFLIGEGVATVLSARQATGHHAIAALSSGNLAAVAKAMRARYPVATLVILADLLKDTGASDPSATEAARSVGGVLAIPNFGADRPRDKKDFNDLVALHGIDAVTACLSGAVAGTDVTAVTDAQPSNSEDFSVTAEVVNDAADVTAPDISIIPVVADRPKFCVFDDLKEENRRKYRPGVWHFGIKQGRKSDDPPILSEQWVCSPLHVDAVTFDGQDNNFGRLIRFQNTNGKWRAWAMPMELLKGLGDELRGELLSMGVEIDPSAKNLLSQYLQSQRPQRRIHSALQVGWCGNSFVLPDTVIGPNASGVIFQSGDRGNNEHTCAGTLEGWQTEISARAPGNPILMLAISAALAGPLLARCNAESGGFHLVGDSSTGKSTALEAGCSVWGGPSYKRSWRATANGMEGAAVLFNDCLLAVDEISECDPKEVGAIVYALGNGRGKQRAGRSGSARNVAQWRCSVLSSGERTIATTMAEGGYRAKAGQSMRILDIPASREFGAWDNLHGAASSAAFSDAIKTAATKHYGHAGRAFLEKLTRDDRDFCERLERIKALPGFQIEGGEGQDKRAAARFATLALAGELATEYGLTGWTEGDAITAAADAFNMWRSQRGRGNDEKRQVLEKISDFIERHGDGRFSNVDIESTIIINNRAGWWRDNGDKGRIYLFTAEGLKEATKSFDLKRALDILQAAGALSKSDTNGERSKPQRISGRLVRVYSIFSDKLEPAHGA